MNNEVTGHALQRRHARVAPLSFGQERLWFIHVTAPGSATYNVPVFLRWHETINLPALRTALDAVTAKHEVLRTTYQVHDGEPVQVIGDPALVELQVRSAEGNGQAQRWPLQSAAKQAREPFDLASRPPLRATVWRGESCDTLLLVIHHIAIDGWSITTLLQDLATAYEAALAGRLAALAEPPVQYADFAIWERAAYHDPQLQRLIDDRVAQLVALPGGLELAGRHGPGRTPEGSALGDQHTFTLPGAVWAQVRSVARTLRATPYVVLLAAFQVVLYRWSGRMRFLVGTLTANRPHPHLEALVGFFVNTVPLRCALEPAWTFAELCAHSRGEAFRSLTYQRIPFHELTRRVTTARARGRDRLVDVGFALQNVPAPRLPAPARWARPVQLPTGTAKFELSLLLEEGEEGAEGLTGTVEFDTDAYPPDTGRLVAAEFLAVLTDAVADPDRSIHRLVADRGGVDPRVREHHGLARQPASPSPTAAHPGRERLTGEQRRAAELFVSALATAQRAGTPPALDELGPESNFFTLGGHSLLAVTLLSTAHRRYGVSLPPRDFLADPTIAGLGRLLAVAPDNGGAAYTSPAAEPPERHPATSVQRRFWFLDRIPALRSAYVLPTLVEYTGVVDPEVLGRALTQVLGRHPALRSRFELDRRRRALFCRTDGAPPAVTVTDAWTWSEQVLAKHLADVSWQPFDLGADTPARGEVITLPDRVVVVVAAHHMVMDGWSQEVLLDQLAEVYRAQLQGRPAALAPPGHPARWSNAEVAEERVAEMVAALSGAPTDVSLPHDRPRGELQSTVGDLRTAQLGPKLTHRLREVVQGQGATMFHATAVLLAVTLANRTGQRDFLFAFPWAGREAAEVADAVGMFVNTLVLRVDLRGEPTWRELLDRVRQASLCCYRNAEVPFDRLAAALHPDRDLSRPAVTPVYLATSQEPSLPRALAEDGTARRLALRPLHVKYELEVTAIDAAQDLTMSASFATALFDGDTVAELLDALLVSATDLVSDPDAPADKES